MAAPIDKLFVREFERKNGQILQIGQSEVGDVGCVVWDAALVLSHFLETAYFLELCGGTINEKIAIELGAGTGIVGIQAACQGLACTVTDLPDLVPLMSLNIEANKQHCTGTIRVAPLTWGTDEKNFSSPDVLLLADCIYYEESLVPLVTCIEQLSEPNTLVICCYEERTTGNKPVLQKKFFELINDAFHITEVPLNKQDELYRSEDIHIMVFKKR